MDKVDPASMFSKKPRTYRRSISTALQTGEADHGWSVGVLSLNHSHSSSSTFPFDKQADFRQLLLNAFNAILISTIDFSNDLSTMSFGLINLLIDCVLAYVPNSQLHSQ